MAQLVTAIRNNMLLGKLTGQFTPLKHVISARDRQFLPPFVIKVDKKLIGIVLSHVKHEEPNTLWIKKIWINPRVFAGMEPIGINGRHPYFDTIVQMLQLFLQTFHPTIKEFDIKSVCYKAHRTEEDQSVLQSLMWFGFNADVEKTLQNHIPRTSWREMEELRSHIYTKNLV